ARSAFDEMSADDHREHDDKADGLLRLDEDRENGESDCGLALSLDQQNERGNKQQGPDRVDLPPERGVVPSHRDEEVERRSDEPRALAEPAPRGPVEDGGDAEVGEDRWHLQQERERRGRGTAEEPQDVHVPGRVVGAGRRRVERARADPRERRRPAGEELHVAGKALLRVEDEREQNAKKQASRKDRDESRVLRERGHFAAARSYSVPKPPAILTTVPFAATQLAMLDDPPPPKPPPGPPPPPRPKPSAPPNVLATAGPALGMAPLLTEATVSSEYATGPARIAARAMTAAASGARPRPMRAGTTRIAAATNAAKSATVPSPVANVGVVASRRAPQKVVTSTATARSMPPKMDRDRSRQRSTVPAPTSAA